MILKFVGWIVVALIIAPLSVMFLDYPYQEYVMFFSKFMYGIAFAGETINFISSRRDDQFAMHVMQYNKENRNALFLIGLIIGIVSFSAVFNGEIVLGITGAYILLITTLNHSLIRLKLFKKEIEQENE